MKTIPERWRDGTDMICSICEEPIFTGQPFNATISHLPQKRDCSHFFCNGSHTIRREAIATFLSEWIGGKNEFEL